MEWSQVISYGGIGLASLIGIAVLLWLVTAIRIILGSRNIPKQIGAFISAAGSGRIDEAYAMTTAAYRRKVPRQKFLQWVNQSQLRQYKSSRPATPKLDGERFTLPVSIELRNGRTTTLQFTFLREGKTWAIDDLQIA
jgi:hypothetical protein